jgi:hypothetical protein
MSPADAIADRTTSPRDAPTLTAVEADIRPRNGDA